jgi:hypothetical protein
MTFLGPSRGSTVLVTTLLEGLSRLSWLALLLGGSCLGALGAIFFFDKQVVNFIKSEKAPLSIQEVYKRTPKQEKEGKGKKHPKNPNRRKPKKPLENQPQNPKTNTSH